jgi:hypothetical protein
LLGIMLNTDEAVTLNDLDEDEITAAAQVKPE